MKRSQAFFHYFDNRLRAAVKGNDMANLKIGSGRTTPGATAWQQYAGGNGIFVDVVTTAGGFITTPSYVTSLGGTSSHWSTTGGSSVYLPAATSFRIYIRWADGAPLSPAQANSLGWHINWIGIEP